MNAHWQVTPGQAPYNPGGIRKVRPTLLLTRPNAQSVRFAGQFCAAFGTDWPVVISPLMRTVWIGDLPETQGIDDIIFSSETAVRAYGRLTERRDMLAWCVGVRTGTVAREAGFAVREGPGDAPGLAALIRAERRGARAFWPHGRQVAHDIARLLEPAGIETLSAVLYDQVSVPPTVAATRLLQGAEPVLLPLFSAGSARLLAGLTITCPLYVALFSGAVPAPSVARQVRTAPHPDSASLLQTLRQLADLAVAG